MSKKVRVETPLDLQVVFIETLGMPPNKIEETFEFGEDKQGYLYAQKFRKKGVWLNDEQFRALADLVTSLNGEYVRGQGLFRIPGPALATPKPTTAIPTAHVEVPTSITALGYYPTFPIDHILSPVKCFRINIAEGLEELMSEIQAAGRIIEPLICRPSITTPGFVYLGPGERRFLAAKELGMKTVPIIVDDFSDVEFDKIRLLENVARKDLTDYEVAQALDYLLHTYPKEYPTQEALGSELQKSQQWISHHLQMLQLEKLNITSRDVMLKIDEGHAREILATPAGRIADVVRHVEEQIKATGRAPSISEMQQISGRRLTIEQPEPVTPTMPSTESVPEVASEPATPKPEFIDIGEFECPECHVKFHVKHVAPNLHRLEKVRKL